VFCYNSFVDTAAPTNMCVSSLLKCIISEYVFVHKLKLLLFGLESNVQLHSV
jgi:hypothetical protein